MVQLVQCLLLIAIVTTAIGGESNAHLNCLSSELSEELSSSAPVLQSKSAKLQVLDTVSSLESDSTTANALSEAESDETVSGTIFETMSDAAFETISMSESITLSETMSDTVSDASPAGFFPVLALNGSLLVAGQMLAMEDNITELFITLQQNYQLLKDEYHLNNSYYHWVTGSLLVTIVLLLLFYREARTHFASYEFAMRDLYKGLSPEGGTHWEYTNNPLNNKVRQTIETEVGDYHPPWWYSPSLGTLVSFGKNLRLNYETDLFRNNSHHFDMQYNSSDWEFTVDWYPSKPNPKEGTVHKIILFFPGLGLGSKNNFAQYFAATVAQEGYYTAVVGARGVDIPLSSPNFWHPGFYDDALAVLQFIERTYSADKVRLFLVGFSAGTNILQKALINNNTNIKISGALCVCINYDYIAARNRLESTFVGCIYSALMAMVYKDILLKNYQALHKSSGRAIVLHTLLSSCVFLSDYDSLVGNLIHGFTSEDQMGEALSMFDSHRISCPLLAIQPADDPLHQGQVRQNLLVERLVSNPNIVFMETKYGNHFGFYEGRLWEAFSNTRSYTYPAKAAMAFFRSVLEQEDCHSVQ